MFLIRPVEKHLRISIDIWTNCQINFQTRKAVSCCPILKKQHIWSLVLNIFIYKVWKAADSQWIGAHCSRCNGNGWTPLFSLFISKHGVLIKHYVLVCCTTCESFFLRRVNVFSVLSTSFEQFSFETLPSLILV